MQLMSKAKAAFFSFHFGTEERSVVIKSDINHHAVLKKIADLFLCQEQSIKISQSGGLFDFFI